MRTLESLFTPTSAASEKRKRIHVTTPDVPLESIQLMGHLADKQKLSQEGREYVFSAYCESRTNGLQSVYSHIAQLINSRSDKSQVFTPLLGRVKTEFLNQLEQNNDVIEYFNFPPGVTVSSPTGGLRGNTYWLKPDAVVMTRNAITVWEVTNQATMLLRLVRDPSSCFMDAMGCWRHRAAEKVFSRFGLKYELRIIEELKNDE